MCGICGVRRFSDAPLQQDMIDGLLLNNQNRGLDATGIALQQANGDVSVYKNDVTAFEFINSAEYKGFMLENLRPDTLIAIGHTRKATQGSPRIINNNHPMFAGQTAVVHNGVLNNDNWLFKEYKLERKAETDSDVFRAVLDKEGFTHKAINILAKLSGSGSFAAISPNYPGKLLFGRSGNPLEMAATQDYLLFSSEKGPLYKALRPYRQVYGIMMREMTPLNYFMIGMRDHSAWLMADKPLKGNGHAGDWLEWHQAMEIAHNSWTPHCYTVHSQYHGQRVRFYEDHPADVVECPGCHAYIPVTEAILSKLKDYFCTGCKTPLA